MSVRGWCPSVTRPMAAADGLLGRISPLGGRLSAAQAKGLARLVGTEFTLTSRGNLQFRGWAPEDYPRLLEGLRALGLGEARNIMTTPFWREGDGTLELSRELAAADLPELPDKFGFAVDTGVRPVLGQVPADIRLERAADGGFLVRADGAAFGERVTRGSAVARMVALAQWFVDSGGAREGRGRMRRHLAAGHLPPMVEQAAPAAALQAPGPGRCAEGMLAAFAFGAMPAVCLARFAGLAEEIRLTPWRMVLLPGVTVLPEMPNVILDAAEPLLRVFACVGAPRCAEAFAETRGLARGLAEFLPAGQALHVSGCKKGCAHAGPVSHALVAEAGGFALLRDGVRERAGLDGEEMLRHPGGIFGND